MNIENLALTEFYRRRGPCRYCKKVCNLCAHHLFSKGSGQVDIPCNLVSIGRDAVVDCSCHVSHHAGNEPLFEELLALSAVDHDCSQDDIERLVMLIRRMPYRQNKDGTLQITQEQYEAIVNRELNFSARRLAMKQMESFRHLLRKEP